MNIWRLCKYTGAMELSFPASMHTGGMGELMHPTVNAPICMLCVWFCVSLRLRVSAYKIQSQCVQHARNYRSDHSHELTALSFCLSGFLLNNKLLFASRCNSGGNNIFIQQICAVSPPPQPPPPAARRPPFPCTGMHPI